MSCESKTGNDILLQLLFCSSCITALVEKIYQAQKERDAAVNARLHLAHSEREELLDKLRRTEREHTGLVL